MIICAAVKIQVEGLDHETIIPCRRHGDAFQIIKDLGCQAKKKYKELKQGFINHNGDFLDRKEALAHALECGQLSAHNKWYQIDNKITELYSEDLY